MVNDKFEIETNTSEEDIATNAVCTPASASLYSESYGIVKEKTFSEEKMISAKRETKLLKCMTSFQIYKIAKLFDFEEDRRTYTKFAYSYCANPNQYYSIMKSLFDFDDYKMELEKMTRG